MVLNSIIFSEIIYFLIKKYIKNGNIRLLIIIIISIVGCMAGKIMPTRLPYAIDVSFVGVGLMLIGESFQINRENMLVKYFQNLEGIEYIILIAITTASIFFNGDINMRQGLYGIISAFWVNVLLSITIGIKLSGDIEKY